MRTIGDCKRAGPGNRTIDVERTTGHRDVAVVDQVGIDDAGATQRGGAADPSLET